MSPEEEARSFGVRLATYSHWPLGWHPIVLDVLRKAAACSGASVYIKEKFGELRIQGGCAELEDAIRGAMMLACTTCIICSGACARPQIAALPVCGACRRSDLDAQWVEF